MTGYVDGVPASVLRAAMDMTMDPQALLEAVRHDDGRITDFAFREVNPAACAYLQRSSEELLGAMLSGVLPGLAGSELFAKYVRCVETGEPLSVDDYHLPSRRFRIIRRFDLRVARVGENWLSVNWRDVSDVDWPGRYRLLAEHAWDVVWTMALNGDITYVSPSVTGLLGYTAEEVMARGAALYTPSSALIANDYLTRVAAAIESGSEFPEYHGEFEYYRKDGSVLSTELSVVPHRRGEGRAVEILGVARDITESKRLRAIDARFRRLMTDSIVPTAIVSPEARYLDVNQAMCDFFGLDAETMRSKTPMDLVAPEYLQETRTVMTDMVARRLDFYRARKQYLHADGHRVWGDLSLSSLPAPDGTLECVVAQLIDVSDEMELRDSKAEADARFRRLMENSGVGMALNTPDGRFEVVNQALCDVLGYDAETLKTMTWQDLTPAAYLAVDVRRIEDLAAGLMDSYRVTKQFIHADGHPVWVDLSAGCIRDHGGALEYFVAQFVDVTDRVEAEQRTQHELDSAAAYVASILPGDLDGPVAVSSRYLPSRGLGGDCFDYRWIDDEHLMVYLIDVSGHGVEPALLAVSMLNLLRSGLLADPILLTPDRVLAELNDRFAMERHGGHYFTMWYGIYRPSDRTLSFVSAGHPPAVAFTMEEDAVRAISLRTASVPVGIFPETDYTCDVYRVPVGARLLLYSDGAFDLRTRDGRQFSNQDFVALCTEMAARQDWSLDHLTARLQSIDADERFDDDCSMVLLTFD